MRKILHIDMNSFYVSVERAEDSSLRGRICAVAGSGEKRDGVILTASYEARKFGVKAGMSNYEAKKKCPNLTLIEPKHDLYKRYSKEVMNILRKYSYKLEQFSIDEGWLDVTHCCDSYEEAWDIAYKIKEEIHERLNITVSVGVSFCKIYSKLASDLAECNGIYILRQSDLRTVIWNLPVESICGVGKKTREKLKGLNIFTIGDLANSDFYLIKAILNKNGITLWKYANGIDDDKVNHLKSLPKSIGISKTSATDILNKDEAYSFLKDLVSELHERVIKYHTTASTVSIVVKTNNFSSYTRQKTRFTPTSDKDAILKDAYTLLLQNWNEDIPIRMLGVSLTKLTYFEEQLSFNI